jgi:hypothetical protein
MLEEERRAMGDLRFRQELVEFLDTETAAFSEEAIQRCLDDDVDPWPLSGPWL